MNIINIEDLYKIQIGYAFKIIKNTYNVDEIWITKNSWIKLTNLKEENKLLNSKRFKKEIDYKQFENSDNTYFRFSYWYDKKNWYVNLKVAFHMFTLQNSNGSYSTDKIKIADLILNNEEIMNISGAQNQVMGLLKKYKKEYTGTYKYAEARITKILDRIRVATHVTNQRFKYELTQPSLNETVTNNYWSDILKCLTFDLEPNKAIHYSYQKHTPYT